MRIEHWEYCFESLLLVMTFKTCLKTVKQKILNCISVSAHILLTITAEFSGVTGTTAAIVKKVKTILRSQAVTRMMQTQETTFVQLLVLIYLPFDFKIHPLTLPSFASHFILSAPQEIFSSHFLLLAPQEMQREGKIILQVLVHTSVCFWTSKSILAFSQRISSAVSHHMLPFPQLSVLWVYSSSPCNEDEHEKWPQTISGIGKGRSDLALESVFLPSFCKKVPCCDVPKGMPASH